MPALIRWTGQRAEAAEDPFTAVGDEDTIWSGGRRFFSHSVLLECELWKSERFCGP